MKLLFVTLLLGASCLAQSFSAPTATQRCYQSVTSGTTASCAFGNNPTTGSVVVVSIITFTGLTAGAGSVVDGAANALSTPVCRTTFDATAGTACMSYYIAPASANKTFTLTVTGGTCGACSIRADEFAVSGGTASLDGSIQTASGSTQAITGPTVTPSGSGELLVGSCIDADVCGNVGGSWTAEPQNAGSFGERAEYQLSASSGQALSFAGNSAANWDAVGGAFKITASGGTTVPKLAIMGVGP